MAGAECKANPLRVSISTSGGRDTSLTRCSRPLATAERRSPDTAALSGKPTGIPRHDVAGHDGDVVAAAAFIGQLDERSQLSAWHHPRVAASPPPGQSLDVTAEPMRRDRQLDRQVSRPLQFQVPHPPAI